MIRRATSSMQRASQRAPWARAATVTGAGAGPARDDAAGGDGLRARGGRRGRWTPQDRERDAVPEDPHERVAVGVLLGGRRERRALVVHDEHGALVAARRARDLHAHVRGRAPTGQGTNGSWKSKASAARSRSAGSSGHAEASASRWYSSVTSPSTSLGRGCARAGPASKAAAIVAALVHAANAGRALHERTHTLRTGGPRGAGNSRAARRVSRSARARTPFEGREARLQLLARSPLRRQIGRQLRDARGLLAGLARVRREPAVRIFERGHAGRERAVLRSCSARSASTASASNPRTWSRL